MSDESEEKFYIDDAIEQIRHKMNEASSSWVKKVMLKMKLDDTRIRTIAVERMKACLAIQHYGLPITTRLLGTVFGLERKKWQTLSIPLHGLGDKNCLILKRGTRAVAHQWIVNPVFWDYFHNGWDDEVQGLDGSVNDEI